MLARSLLIAFNILLTSAWAGTTVVPLSGTASNFVPNPYQSTYNAAQIAIYVCATGRGNIYFRYAYGAENGTSNYLYFYPVSSGDPNSTTGCTTSANTAVSGRQNCVFYNNSSGRWSIYLGSPSTLGSNLPASVTQTISNNWDCNNYALQSGVTPAICDGTYTCTKQ